MLIYNLERIYKARGIERPYTFFKAHGFSDSFASKVKNGKVSGMRLATMEKLCSILHCAPHDLMEWVPDDKTLIAPNHPLRALRAESKPPDMTSIFKSIPLDKIKHIKEYIEQGFEASPEEPSGKTEAEE